MTTSESSIDNLHSTIHEVPAPDRSSREFAVSTFSTVLVPVQDYYEYHRKLDSIEARLQILKRDAGLA